LGDLNLVETTIGELQSQMASGECTSTDLVHGYLARIAALDRHGPTLKSVVEINPAASEIAAGLDAERRARGPRGPLHGIPILIKDNIDTADAMLTTAGSLALVDSRPARDAFVVQRLREAGAVLLGKTNLSEWANFRSTHSSSGWSARGGQCRNPYALDRSPCGSSSGSAAAVAANLAAVSLGTETDGSILCPGAMCGVVGIKPTVGLTSRSGVVPIAHSQDTVGSFGRTVRDASLVLGMVTGTDSRDPASLASEGRRHDDYTPFLQRDGLRGTRIGVAREVYCGYSDKADRILAEALDVMRDLGATIVDPADIPTARAMASGPSELEVLLYEFKADLDSYLGSRDRAGAIRSLHETIAFNAGHAGSELPYFGQELFEMADAKGPLTDAAYQEALATNHRLSRDEGIDAVVQAHQLDALVMPTTAPAFKIDLINGDPDVSGSSQPAALAGYPAITVPAGFAGPLPVGITFIGTAFAEPILITLAYAFEQATQARQVPRFEFET
jgi:amidase